MIVGKNVAVRPNDHARSRAALILLALRVRATAWIPSLRVPPSKILAEELPKEWVHLRHALHTFSADFRSLR